MASADKIKLRHQRKDLTPKNLRMKLPGQLAADLDAYRRLYRETHREEISLPEVVEAILEQFLRSDRAFQRHKRGEGGSGTSVSEAP